MTTMRWIQPTARRCRRHRKAGANDGPRSVSLTVDLGRIRQQVEGALEQCLPDADASEVGRAARYVTLGGGHRWRSLLAITAGRMFDADADRVVMPLACSLEMLHAASLVLDDLPSMDNATIRRGRLCAHLAFPRWAVDMVPAFLVNLAYRVALDNPLASQDRRIRVALLLGQVGTGLARGQELDLTVGPGGGDAEGLLECYRLKTGHLFAAATQAGGILCGADEDDAKVLEQAGMNLGLAYQFLDDVSDATGLPSRPLGEDVGRCTAVSLYGLDGARIRAATFGREAIGLLGRFGPDARLLRSLIDQVNSDY